MRGRDPWRDAVAHHRADHPRWGPLIERVGPCTLRPRKDRLAILVRAIVGQQISARAASTIWARMLTAVGDPLDPGAYLALGEPGIRAVGLSGVKARYVLNLAGAIADGSLPIKRIGRLPDREIVERLMTVKGVGVWTAEMFLIFALNRPDVLPVGDLGIRVGIRTHYGLDALPSPAQCRELTASWRPHRTVAMWYLWREIDGQSASRSPVS